ncbi:uncharacterized protein LOC143876556 [Tasmannia lanceolata]|uniref:uncharacterized protein LOC143876556 n=1 Tax=Tasmannia lanceolata TaxID=3420 RepID=UPI004062BA34
MANGWVKSLQCKSRAFEDVYHPSPKYHLNLLNTSSCKKSVQSLKEIVENTHKKPRKRHTRPSPPPPPPPPPPPAPSSRRPRAKIESGPNPTRTSPSARTLDPFFPTLTELPEGHSSRNVVEIIFHSSWSNNAFQGKIEMLFKVQNLPKTIACFEEYREMVKSRAGGGNPGSRKENARCVADGNEVMRFHCVGPTAGGICEAGGLCTFSGKGGAIRTFPGSGGAHESAGGGKGRRAMLICRVIAGRICKGVESFLQGSVGGFDSVSGDNGSLVVFDSRALLPCFLIIYKV